MSPPECGRKWAQNRASDPDATDPDQKWKCRFGQNWRFWIEHCSAYARVLSSRPTASSRFNNVSLLPYAWRTDALKSGSPSISDLTLGAVVERGGTPISDGQTIETHCVMVVGSSGMQPRVDFLITRSRWIFAEPHLQIAFGIYLTTSLLKGTMRHM